MITTEPHPMVRKYPTRDKAKDAVHFLRQCLEPDHWPQLHGRKVIVYAGSEPIVHTLKLAGFEDMPLC